MQKRFEGQEEEILDPDLPIIDAHHHLFDRPPATYLLADYLADAGLGHRIVSSVYVETLAFARTRGPEVLRPLGEVEFANGVAATAATDRYGDVRVADAIVGYADLTMGAAIGELLDRSIAAAPDRFRGVRQLTMDYHDAALRKYFTNPPEQGLLGHPRFRTGFAEIGVRGLSFDVAAFHYQLGDIAQLADAFPETALVLNHMGMALGIERDEAGRAEVFREWRAALTDLAQRPNVTCKVGGLGLLFWGFGLHEREDVIGSRELAALWRPYVETAVEAFGAERCMMESNYPVDGRSCGFVPLWNALKLITAGASAGERTALFSGTAARVYRIAAP